MASAGVATLGRGLSKIADNENAQRVGQGNAALPTRTAGLLLHPFLNVGAEVVGGQIFPTTDFIQTFPIGGFKTNLDIAPSHNQSACDQRRQTMGLLLARRQFPIVRHDHSSS